MFLEGIRQLRAVQLFLQSKPTFLCECGFLSASLDTYSAVRYVLIARDHFVWVDPNTDFPVVEHEVCKTLARKHIDLRSSVAELLSINWLPVEGADFTVRLEPAEANGVVVESEISYAPGA